MGLRQKLVTPFAMRCTLVFWATEMSVAKGANLMCYLKEVDDPRKPSNGTLHEFVEMLVITVVAVLSDCDTVEDIAYWARAKEAWLRKFLLLTNGVPSEETFFQSLEFWTGNNSKVPSGAGWVALSAP